MLQVSTRLGLFYIWHRLLSSISQLKKKNRETKNQKSKIRLGHSIGWLVARCRYFREQTPPWTPPCGSVSHSSRIYHPCSLCQSVYKKESRAIRGVCSGIDEIVYYFYYRGKKEKEKIRNFKRKGKWMKKCSILICAVDIRNACPDIYIFFVWQKTKLKRACMATR